MNHILFSSLVIFFAMILLSSCRCESNNHMQQNNHYLDGKIQNKRNISATEAKCLLSDFVLEYKTIRNIENAKEFSKKWMIDKKDFDNRELLSVADFILKFYEINRFDWIAESLNLLSFSPDAVYIGKKKVLWYCVDIGKWLGPTDKTRNKNEQDAVQEIMKHHEMIVTLSCKRSVSATEVVILLRQMCSDYGSINNSYRKAKIFVLKWIFVSELDTDMDKLDDSFTKSILSSYSINRLNWIMENLESLRSHGDKFMVGDKCVLFFKIYKLERKNSWKVPEELFRD